MPTNKVFYRLERRLCQALKIDWYPSPAYIANAAPVEVIGSMRKTLLCVNAIANGMRNAYITNQAVVLPYRPETD